MNKLSFSGKPAFMLATYGWGVQRLRDPKGIGTVRDKNAPAHPELLA
jgi:hypothetical protein